MRLNPDCMRAVLLEMEKTAYGQSMTAMEVVEALPEFCQDDVAYSIYKLYEAGFLDVKLGKTYLYEEVKTQIKIDRINDITYAGHQFLANIREDNIWKGVKGVAKKVGSTSIDAFTQIASNVITELIKAQFGIGGMNLPNMQ